MDPLQKIVSLSKRRGFIFPSSEIYGGFSACYDFGPVGVELLRNIKDSWWNFFVTTRQDVVGLDTAIFMNPKVWEASGHTKHFTDPLMDCKSCKKRMRADKPVEEKLKELGKDFSEVNFKDKKDLTRAVKEYGIVCENCGGKDFTEIRDFNTLFETYQGVIKGEKDVIYLRGEIAQGMFVQFKNVIESMRAKLPLGMAQQGKAFRNEVTTKNFIFRTREFDLMEIEYFVKPGDDDKYFSEWKENFFSWYESLGLSMNKLRWREQTPDERAHYSKQTFDAEYKFPWGFDEIGAVANRTDYDLSNHTKKSGEDLKYTDPQTGEKYIPYVIEPTFGITRALLAIMLDAYHEEEINNEKRIVLRFHPKIAPVKAAILPLIKKDEKQVVIAKNIFEDLLKEWNVMYDDGGSIGRRYRRQDEIGTPFAVTIDHQSIEDGMVTVRDRDSLKQERINISGVKKYLAAKLV